MKKNIAVVAGGDSSEVVVSLKSAEGIESFLDKERYNVYLVTIAGGEWTVRLPGGGKAEVNRNDFSFVTGGRHVRFDYAYVTIHGTPGENGLLQGYFELVGVPHSSCHVFTSALTFNKFACNHFLRGFGVRVAESLLLRRGQTVTPTEVEEKIGYPCFVKPNLGGSSFGISKVKTPDELLPAISKAFSEGDEVLVEAFMQGTELTCGIFKTREGGTTVLPVTEVVTHNEFFDYDAKYNGQVDEITPARISDSLTRRVQKLTSTIYELLDCRGIVRMDYIVTKDEVINLLEVNTTPGMTSTSFIPQQVHAAGLDMTRVLTDIIESGETRQTTD